MQLLRLELKYTKIFKIKNTPLVSMRHAICWYH